MRKKSPVAVSVRITPSAVSQRIKALKRRVGQVLVVREKPCAATAAEPEALAEMGGSDGAAPRIAVASRFSSPGRHCDDG